MISSFIRPSSKMLFLAFFVLINTLIASAQWSINPAVNQQISGLEIADQETVSTNDGKLWVAFYQLTPQGNYDMRAQLFDEQGNKLLGPDGVLVSDKPSGSAIYVFNVCLDVNNNLVIGCQDQRSGSDQCVLFKISQTGTHLWDADGIILGGGLAPSMALLTNGEIVAVWNDDASSTLKMQKFSTDGTPVWSSPIAIYVNSSKTTRGQIVSNSNGRFTMVYQKKGTAIYTTLYAQQFYNTGISQYPPLQISNETTQGIRYYSVQKDNDVTYVGYHSSVGNRFNSWLQRINPDGTLPWGINGSHFNTNTGPNDNYQMETNINLMPGSPYVWAVCSFTNTTQNLYGIYIQKFLKTTGARLFTDQAKMVYPVNSARNKQIGNLILINDEPMFAHYEGDDKIYVTKLNESGIFVWPYSRTTISSTTAGAGNPKMRHNFNSVGNARCAAVWTENRLSGYLGYIQGISVGGLFGIDIATEGGIPATISQNAGVLQLTKSVFPSYANQEVSWSIEPGTGNASISSTGLVTAVSDGIVWAKAAAIQDVTVVDSILITISGQTNVPANVGDIKMDFEVCPNPGSGKFEIVTNSLKTGKYNLEIFNTAGEIVLKKKNVFIEGPFIHTINLENLPAGSYMVIICNKEITVSKKIILKN